MVSPAEDPDWLHRNVPDPCRPLADYFDHDDHGRRWVSQRQRRSMIFATARAMMTQNNFEQVHVHEVAARCGVSVQTIYNLIGKRAELMLGSAEEWVAAIAVVAMEDAEQRGLDSALNLLEMFWSAALTAPGYVSSAVRTNPADALSLRRRFIQAGTQAFLIALAHPRREQALRDTVDMRRLARQLASVANTTIQDWLVEPYPVGTFYRDLVNGPGLMLAGALQGEQAHRLERRLAEIR